LTLHIRDMSQTDAAYIAIRRDVVSCRLAPGAEITEQELSAVYGFGKTPIREALGRLAKDGLVRAVPRRGYLVTPINIKDVQDIFELRSMLEPKAARLAAGRVDGEELRYLDEILRAAYRAVDWETSVEFLQAHTDFHLAIVRATGNERLVSFTAQLLSEVERLLHAQIVMGFRLSAMGHGDLVDALVTGDGEKAAQICAAQIETDRNRAIANILANSESLSLHLPVGA